MAEKQKSKIFRFKFSITILEKLKKFSLIHRYDESKIFKENWEIWMKENEKLINLEKKILESKGYRGDILEKMYKSVRYYFKNKSNKKTEPKKRRIYTRLDEELLIWMDTHISRNNNKKPVNAFNEFMEYTCSKTLINKENTSLSDAEFKIKIKKTYKNRFFNFNKQ
jgi:hypothetical protein